MGVGGPDLIVKRDGPFKSANLNVMGQVCQAEAIKRDIVFLIDVSGSMGVNDKRYPKSDSSSEPAMTCGRQAAIETVLGANGKNPQARFAMVTFHSEVNFKSQKFGSAPDLLSGSNGAAPSLSQVVCQSLDSTFYDKGLREVQALFGNSEKGTQKELYFVTDGQPQGADPLPIAQELKNMGVIIATIMVAGDDTILKQMASTRNNELLHRKVEQADQLASAIAALVENEIERAWFYSDLITTNAVEQISGDALSWEELMFDPQLGHFKVSSKELKVDKEPGLEIQLKLKYKNSAEPSYLRSRLLWPVKSDLKP
jgi:hypothetical protein